MLPHASSSPLPLEASSQEERVPFLDALRGVALFGVFFANLQVFSGYSFLSPAERAALDGPRAARTFDFLQAALVDGRFYTLFSLLFGIGFAIFLQRATARGADGIRLFRRRLLGLLLIGTAHSLFLWQGDILVLYALLGFLLVPLRRWEDRPLLGLAVVLILAPIAMDLLEVASGGWSPGAPLLAFADAVTSSSGGSIGNLAQVMARMPLSFLPLWNAGGSLYRWGELLESDRLFKVFGIFLLGFVAGRAGWAASMADRTPWIRRVLRWLLPLGLMASLAMGYFALDGSEVPEPAGLLDTLSYALGVVPLALGYAGLLALAWQTGPGRRVLSAFIPAGRMALTNYLAQSGFGILVFYGFGGGYAGAAGPLVLPLVAVGFFSCQGLLSTLWLRRFRQGPMEALWRRFTYGGAS